MAHLVKITGISKVVHNLKKARGVMGKRYAKGLKAGGLFLQRLSQQIVPIDTGNLRGTADTHNIGGEGFDADIVVHYGAGAAYAVYVHENLDARHAPGKTAKYLERPAREKRKEIIQVIRDRARGK
jgi:hypothetical protein